MGVLGVYLGDLVVAVGLVLVLLPSYAKLVRPVFSMRVLRECLRFGIPRVPHGAAHQVIAGADRYILSRFVDLREVGVYSVGANLGLGLKLFLSAFENAWAPFYFGEMTQPDAKATFRVVTTYGVAILLLLLAGLSGVAYDLVRLMTIPRYYGAADIVPWIGLGVALQGVYLLTSIGLNITKRTAYYPAATGIAAVTSVAMNLLLIPRFGVLGAAWSNVAAYGVLAATAMAFSQRFYPMSYEWGRLARLVVAAALSILAARTIAPHTIAPVVGVLLRGTTVVVVFAGVLAMSGFASVHERTRIRAIWKAFASRRRIAPPPESDTME
jgi:O-antigen/teichoic acid export membrane protein